MALLRPTDEYNFQAAVTFSGGATLPAGSITNESIVASASIVVTKLHHRYKESFTVAAGVAASSISHPLSVIENSGSIESFEVTPLVIPASTVSKYDVDLEVAAAGSTFVSILSAPITIGASDTNLTPRAATITTSTLIDGNSLQIRITPTGSSLGSGLVAMARWNETNN